MSKKEYSIKTYHRGRESVVTGTLAYLTGYFSYTLTCGHDYNRKIPLKPKTFKSLVSALNRSVNEMQGGCYDRDYYMESCKLRVSVLPSRDEGFGGWATGFVYVGGREYRYETEHFEVGSGFGIDGGRVSKLFITRNYPRNRKPRREVCAYDRGWDIRPSAKNAADMAAYDAILKKYN